MIFKKCAILATILAGTALSSMANAQARIKDIATFEGVRENQLIGYGLVVGLNGTGDNARNAPFTQQSIEGMLERLGVGNIPADAIKTKNTAAVMVTANLPPFSRAGSSIDITVSSLGDAKSLQGGTLLITPLMAADGEIYAVGQGPISVAGFAAQGDKASLVEGVPTVARIQNGAIVEREVEFDLNQMPSIRISLRNPDFTTAKRLAEAINDHDKEAQARVLDSATVEFNRSRKKSIALQIAEFEGLKVTPDTVAKVIIDAKSGTIVMGSNVKIDDVAISQGGLTIRITETAQVVQPEPITIGDTVVIPETKIEVEEKDARFVMLEGGDVTLKDLVDGLNKLGVSAQQTISILQGIKAAGALHAELEII